MADRICIRIRDRGRMSPTLFSRYSGLTAIVDLHDALEVSRGEASNIMCNLILRMTGGKCYGGRAIGLCNDEEFDKAGNMEHGVWTFDLQERMWEYTAYNGELKKLTMEEAAELAYTIWPERRKVEE